ncbi:T9SS C-terminal target domain-containing protein [Chryseobacterium sp. G0186]|uniref:T9SS type A sorting domain-containing protein n=1 Tax=Chryseobacterium sp. G0186 TaxID=2487064 RepID=UPI000F4D4016|nr:T9SS type A sorting domain-containing protein [Chryseobacterium sp. G0186]AZA76738.1 T9SS C-terminal target domain-containing protein [Chryseobacterium sp. G0186]
MKKYYSIAFSLFAAFSFAQQMTSFENNEGFTDGNIHGQGAWISTPTGGTPENVTHQIICTDNATHGNSSLKLVREPTYGTQPEPIIGGFYNLSTPLVPTNFSVSFDINISQLNGSVFGFQGVNSVTEQNIVRLDFDKNGIINVLKTISGIQNLISTSGVWTSDTWYRCMVVGTAMDIRYYLNEVLIYTGTANSSSNIDQLRFVHNNAFGVAYIDHIKVNTETVMAVKETAVNAKEIILYPNPVTDFLQINSSSKIKYATVYDLTGKRMEVKLNDGKVDVRSLLAGEYLLNVETDKGNFTEKFIKK